MNEQRITIEHQFTEDMGVAVESSRNDKTIEVRQWVDGKCYYINLSNDEAYKLIDMIRIAMEVKI